MISLSPSRTLKSLMTCALMGFAAVSHSQQVLRVTAIPDESPTELARKFGPLGKYLEAKLGMKVEWTPVTDYAAAVETLVNKKVDLDEAWLADGGRGGVGGRIQAITFGAFSCWP